MVPHARSSRRTKIFHGCRKHTIQLVIALLYWGMYGPQFRWVDWAYSLNPLIFFALAIWARRTPVIPATIALALYAAHLGLQASLSFDLLWCGWQFKVPVATLLIIALACGFVRHKELKESSNEPSPPG